MTVDANIEVARFEGATAVPLSSLLQEEGRSWVWSIEDGVVRRRDVEVLGKGDRYVAVAQLPTDTVVVENAALVEVGSRVEARLGTTSESTGGR